MAKHHTKNYRLDESSIADIAELAHEYVQHWTRSEAQKLIKEELIILPTKQGLQVGKYAIKHANKRWFVYNFNNELVDIFTCKQSAVFYAVLDQRQQYNKAWSLQRQDTRVSKLEQDKTNYIYRRSKAIKKCDFVTSSILDARLAEVESSLALAQAELEKTLFQAKYLKGLWE